MPLVSGSSRAAVSENIKTERGSGKPEAQAVAISLSKAGLSNRSDAKAVHDALQEIGDSLRSLKSRMDARVGGRRRADIGVRLARLKMRRTDDGSDPYPVKLTIELTDWENLNGLIEFWRYVRKAANAGHGFTIEADREEGYLPEFWDGQGEGHPHVYCDGDGNDHVGRILLNGEDVTDGD